MLNQAIPLLLSKTLIMLDIGGVYPHSNLIQQRLKVQPKTIQRSMAKTVSIAVEKKHDDGGYLTSKYVLCTCSHCKEAL